MQIYPNVTKFMQIDITKCCLLSGWEYTVDAGVASYVAVEKTYHMSRRRRWVRGRSLMKSTGKEDKVHKRHSRLHRLWHNKDVKTKSIMTALAAT